MELDSTFKFVYLVYVLFVNIKGGISKSQVMIAGALRKAHCAWIQSCKALKTD